MIYNNSVFMNVPLEVLIRKYRETLTSNQFNELVQVWPAFQKYLTDFKRDEKDEFDHFREFLVLELKTIHSMIVSFRNTSEIEVDNDEAEKEFFLRVVNDRRDEALKRPLDNYLSDKTLEQFSLAYGGFINAVAEYILDFDLTDDLCSSLHDMMFAIVKSNQKTASYTGLVFAGFGKDEIFPKLDYVEVDGLYLGNLRVLSHNTVDIDRRGVTADIVPFAQKEMPERFIMGIDSGFERAVQGIADNMVGQIVDQIVSMGAFENDVADQIRGLARDQFGQLLSTLKKKNADELRSVVNHLSKKELGEFAYSLVDFTSRKRRYSSELETVGGPIDVAILTKNEGFIWVRRKHYFDPTLNPQYSPYAQR